MNLLQLQKKYNKPIVIKIKTRPTTNINDDLEYLKNVFAPDLQIYSLI